MIQISTRSNETTVSVVGDLDLAAREHLPEVAARLRGLDDDRLVVDMCRSAFMDSAGAAFLIELARVAIDRASTAILRGCGDRDLFVLEICNALEHFEVDAEHHCDLGRDALVDDHGDSRLVH